MSDQPLECAFHSRFREELAEWVKIDRRVALKILDLIENVMKNPFTGPGKPEPLKYLGPNIWSRRITQEHRLVYLVSQTKINFLQCRYHY
ncbi:MAG: Txe/YoeB family addiction module toxin [Bacteroidetes bacterium]|nr:Txe/YoeB family addiction module toxin [Bacteroidota bacterium]